MRRRNLLRHRHPFVLLAVFLAGLVALQVALHLWPLLLAAGAVWLGLRWWHRRSRYLGSRTARPPLVQGQVLDDGAELEQLRSDNAKLRTKVRVLSDMINGPEARP